MVSPVRQTYRSLESLVRLIVTLPLRAVVPLTQVPARPRPVLAVVVVSVAAVVVTLVGWRGTAVLPRAVAAAACGPSWVTAWQAAMQPGPAPRAVAGGGTLRMVVRPQVEGAQIRVRLSNVYGSAPLAVDAVSAARAGGGGGASARSSQAGRATAARQQLAETRQRPAGRAAQARRERVAVRRHPRQAGQVVRRPSAGRVAPLRQRVTGRVAPLRQLATGRGVPGRRRSSPGRNSP